MTRVENRWYAILKGLKNPTFETCGDYDLYVQMAFLFNWHPDEVDRLDPGFIEELKARLKAQDRLSTEERKKQEAEIRQMRAKSGRRGRKV